ncbi:MAG: hypothetical protein Q9162_006734 [Coniocarpon cinnabarinum]
MDPSKKEETKQLFDQFWSKVSAEDQKNIKEEIKEQLVLPDIFHRDATPNGAHVKPGDKVQFFRERTGRQNVYAKKEIHIDGAVKWAEDNHPSNTRLFEGTRTGKDLLGRPMGSRAAREHAEGLQRGARHEDPVLGHEMTEEEIQQHNEALGK